MRRSLLARPRFAARDFEVDPDLAFVVMPLSQPFLQIFADHIKEPLRRELSMRTLKADDLYGPEAIMEDIWQQLNIAGVVIADLTGRNPNVFYEVGIAHTLGKPVVMVAQHSEDVPFDVGHIRYVEYEYTPRGMKEFERSLVLSVAEARREAVQELEQEAREVERRFEEAFQRWKRVGALLIPSDDTFYLVNAHADHLAPSLDSERVAFLLRSAMHFGVDFVYWAERNADNDRAEETLLEVLGRPERRPAHRAGLAIEHLSPRLRASVIAAARTRFGQDPNVMRILDAAESGSTLAYWEDGAGGVLSPQEARELIYQANRSRRYRAADSAVVAGL